MAANVTLTVNVEQAKAALNQVNSAITQIKLNGSQITIGGQRVSQQMNQVANSTEKVAKTTEQAGKTSEQNINKITKAFKSVTGASSKALTSIRGFASGMTSVWTAVVVAVELASVSFKYFFENLTESIPKVIAKSQNLVTITEKQANKFKKEKQESDQLKKSLQGLADKEALSNTQQLLAQAIIDKLNKKYKDLRLSIDQTTGAIKGLSDAEYKMNQQDRERQIRLTRQQMFAQRQAVNAQLANTFGTSKVSLDKDVSGRDFFTFAENTFGDLSSLDRDRLAKKFSEGDLKTKRKVLADLATDYSNNQQIVTKLNGAIDAIDKLIDLQQNFNDLNSAASRIIENENSKLDSNKKKLEQINSLKEKSQAAQKSLLQAQKEQQFNALQTNQQKVDYLKNELESLQKESDSLTESIKSATDQLSHNAYLEDISSTQTSSFKKQMDENDEAVTKLRQNISELERQFKKVSGKEFSNDYLSVDYRDKTKGKINSLTERINSMPAEYSQSKQTKYKLQDQRAELQKQLDIINTILKNTKEISVYDKQRERLVEGLNSNLQIGNKAEQDRLKTEKELEELKTQQAEKQLQIQQKKVQLTEQEKAIAEENARIQNIFSDYEKQLQAYNKSQEEIAYETALINAQKTKGAALTQEQIDQVKFYVNQLNKMKQLQQERAKKKRQEDAIEGVFTNYQEKQTVAYLKLVQKQKEAVLLEAKLNAQKAKGAALTEEEYNSLKNYVDVQQMLEQANGVNSNLSFKGQNIITNQLAQKGGFASSIVVDRAQDVNKEILAVQNKQYDLQNQIKSALDNYSVIQ